MNAVTKNEVDVALSSTPAVVIWSNEKIADWIRRLEDMEVYPTAYYFHGRRDVICMVKGKHHEDAAYMPIVNELNIADKANRQAVAKWLDDRDEAFDAMGWIAQREADGVRLAIRKSEGELERCIAHDGGYLTSDDLTTLSRHHNALCRAIAWSKQAKVARLPLCIPERNAHGTYPKSHWRKGASKSAKSWNEAFNMGRQYAIDILKLSVHDEDGDLVSAVLYDIINKGPERANAKRRMINRGMVSGFITLLTTLAHSAACDPNHVNFAVRRCGPYQVPVPVVKTARKPRTKGVRKSRPAALKKAA